MTVTTADVRCPWPTTALTDMWPNGFWELMPLLFPRNQFHALGLHSMRSSVVLKKQLHALQTPLLVSVQFQLEGVVILVPTKLPLYSFCFHSDSLNVIPSVGGQIQFAELAVGKRKMKRDPFYASLHWEKLE